MNEKLQESCNLCGSPSADFLFEIPDLWMDRTYITARYVKCRNCELVYQNPQSAEEFSQLYPEEYQADPAQNDFISSYGLKKRAAIIIEHKTSGKLLDVGCGNGEFLRHIKSYPGWELVGIDPNRRLIPLYQGYNEIRFLPCMLEEAAFRASTFDVVTLWDVLEHVKDPTSTLVEIQRILKPNGIVVLRLPNFGSKDRSIFGKYWAGFDSPRHYYVFNQHNITRMLEKTGFGVIEIRTDVGGYLNFLKSFQFLMFAKKTQPAIKNVILGILKSLPFRIAASPLMKIKDKGNRGSEMVVVGKRNR